MPTPLRLRQRRWQRLATLLVALALLAVAFALYAGQRRTAQRGPWALAVLPDRTVWLSVNQQLWRLDADGRRQHMVDTAALGGTVGVLTPHPSGRIVAWVRGSPALHVLDADTGAAQQRIEPQWPDDLRRHADEAIHLTFAPDGRFAIATGGGHAVALFDAQGRFLARSAPGVFRFTNGLWWQGDGWWATDTNGMALVLLDDASLAERRRVTLANAEPAWLFLGEAVASRGAPSAGAAPLGTLSRLSNGMEYGQIVDVFSDGSQRAFELPAATDNLVHRGNALAPRSLAWLDGRLLVTDGVTLAVRAWGTDRRLQADWGDAAVRHELAQIHTERERWRQGYVLALLGAVLALVAGLLMMGAARRIERRLKLAEADPELAPALLADSRQGLGIAGHPTQPGWRQALLLAGLLWPPMALVLFVQMGGVSRLLQLWVSATEGWPAGWRWGGIVVMVALLMLGGMLLLVRAMLRVQSHPGLESLTNQGATRLLARPDAFWPQRQPGEQPREVLMLQTHGGWSRRWLVLTNQRLLLFRMNLNDVRLEQAWPRAAVRDAALRSPAWWPGESERLRFDLHLRLRGGQGIRGRVSSLPAAQRVVALLRRAPAAAGASAGASAKEGLRVHARATDDRLATRQSLASLLVPGAGQWWQGRQATALWMFVPWLLLMLYAAFVVWMAWGSRTEVSPLTLWTSVALPLVAGVLAAIDAWRMR